MGVEGWITELLKPLLEALFVRYSLTLRFNILPV